MYNDVLMKNPNLGTSIVELLLGQFNKYYNWNENANPPISLSACVEIKIDNPVLIEPIGHLINAICICIVSFPTLPTNDDEPEGPASVAKLESGMKSLVKRIIASDLEDFEMDKSSDFGNNTSVGQKNQYLASQLLGIIEALMDWIFKTGNSSLESCKNFISLFEIHQKVMKIVIEKSTAWSGKPKGKKRKDAADETAASTSQVEVPIQKETGKTKPKNMFYSRKSLLSLDMICKLFYSTFYEADNNESESSAMLRGNESLHRYCLETVEQIVANLESYTKSEALCETLATIAKCMMKIYNCDFDESESTQRRKGRYLRTLSLFCIELLVKITKFFCNLSDNSFLHKFIFHLKSKSIQSQECNDTTSSVAYVRYSSSLVKTFEKNVIRRLSEDIEELTPAEKNSFYKEVTQMLNFIQLLVCRMECYAIISEGNEKQNLCSPAFNWAKQMCIQQKIDDVQTCVAFMNLYLELSHQQKFVNDDYPYSEVALGLRITMGNIDNDKTVEGVNKYGVINEKSAVNILNLLIQHLERILSDIVWILDAIKSGGFGVDSSKTENKICKQLGIVIFSAHHIIQIAIRTNIDTVSKFMIKIYNVLINFTKHNLSFYSRKFKNVPKICNNFEKLVKLCGSHLNPPVLEFISYVEEKIDTTPTKKPRTTIAEKNKVLKETKQIPNLSYAQEQFYHFLLSLGKKAKIDFSSHIKSGAARDFRINLIQVQEALNAEEDDNESIDEPPAKRKNVASSSKPITSPAKQSTPITQNKTTQNDSSPKPGKGPSQNSARKGKSRLGRSK